MNRRRAGLNSFTGRSWPAGGTLPITELDKLEQEQTNIKSDTVGLCETASHEKKRQS